MQARELMTPRPVCCTPRLPLIEAARRMAEHDCGALPVVDGEGSRRPIGMVTDRDIVVRTLAAGRDPMKLVVEDCMSGPCVTVTERTNLDDLCDTMEANQIRRLIVVDDDGLVTGIVAQADVAEAAPGHRAVEVLREVSLPSSSLRLTF